MYKYIGNSNLAALEYDNICTVKNEGNLEQYCFMYLNHSVLVHKCNCCL
jgi:hypothetical protein